MDQATWAVVVAAGRGSRFGAPKQLSPLGGRRVVDWSVDACRSVASGVVLVVPEEHVDELASVADVVVAGGPTRSESVRRGLDAVPTDARIVVVHDAARPLASPALFRRVVEAVEEGADGAVPARPVVDTVKQVDAHGRVLTTLDRTTLVAVQTPQAFRAAALLDAHAAGAEATDDAALVEARGGTVVTVPGEEGNVKITVPGDLELAEARLGRTAAPGSEAEGAGDHGEDEG